MANRVQEGQQGAFPIAGKHETGYRREPVEAFLEQARLTYEGNLPAGVTPLHSGDVRRKSFPIVKNGYSARYVDAALDRLEEVFYERERRTLIREQGEDVWWDQTRALLSEVRGRLNGVRGKRFKRRSMWASGYNRQQVDAFLDRVAEMFDRREVSMKPAEVREVVFHAQWRGYDEAQVDALLDGIVELILATR